jgi:hypothetical protein
MNVSADQVRAATRSAAAVITPDSLPPLRLDQPTADSIRTHQRRTVWIAPLATVAVVAIVIAGVVVTGSHIGRSGTPARPHAAKQRTAGDNVNTNTVPAYYVAITDSPQATVRATATGDTLSSITANAPIVGVTGAADDRTFILDAQRSIVGGSVTWVGQPTFYLLRLTTSGTEKSLTRLSFPALPSGTAVSGLALSSDGSKLAVEALSRSGDTSFGPMEIVVYTLATGAHRTWYTNDSADPGDPGFTGSGVQGSATISWAADSTTLAFDWENPSRTTGVRLLNTTAAGDDLIADSRLAVVEPSILDLIHRSIASGSSPFTPPYYVSGCETDAIMSQNGASVVCGYSSDAGSGKTAAGFVLYSTTTGKQEGAVGFFLYKRKTSGEVRLYWTSSTGTLLVGAEPTATGNRLGVIDGDKFTPLPGNTSFVDAAW